MAGLSICNVQEVYYPLALFMGGGVVERGGAAKKSMFWSQSYKHDHNLRPQSRNMECFQVRYDSRVVIYKFKLFIRLATGLAAILAMW